MIGGECATDVRYACLQTSAHWSPRGTGKEGPGESVGIEERTASESGSKPGASP